LYALCGACDERLALAEANVVVGTAVTIVGGSQATEGTIYIRKKNLRGECTEPVNSRRKKNIPGRPVWRKTIEADAVERTPVTATKANVKRILLEGSDRM